MSAEIHRITAAGPIVEPDQDVIDQLRSLLERAEAGAIKSIGFFYVGGNDRVGTGWVSGCAMSHLMVTGASRLFHRVMAADAKDETE